MGRRPGGYSMYRRDVVKCPAVSPPGCPGSPIAPRSGLPQKQASRHPSPVGASRPAPARASGSRALAAMQAQPARMSKASPRGRGSHKSKPAATQAQWEQAGRPLPEPVGAAPSRRCRRSLPECLKHRPGGGAPTKASQPPPKPGGSKPAGRRTSPAGAAPSRRCRRRLLRGSKHRPGGGAPTKASQPPHEPGGSKPACGLPGQLLPNGLLRLRRE